MEKNSSSFQAVHLYIIQYTVYLACPLHLLFKNKSTKTFLDRIQQLLLHFQVSLE